MKKILPFLCCIAALLCCFQTADAKGPLPDKLPESVVDISKENTYPNPSHDTSELVPGGRTKSLLETANVPIENPTLIRLLNESSIHPSKWSIGYSAKIYLGEWPLNYKSKETSVNWEYKKINDNAVDARGSESGQKLVYVQKVQAKITGGLTAEVPKEDEVNQLIMAKAMQKTHLPISFSTIIGSGTRIDRPYQVQAKQIGHLYGYVPAVNEKGKITYGEVYLVLKAGNANLEVKNIMQQGIGAWMPIQDHLSLRYLAQ
ncbi:YfkD family protein [Sporolactobacillus pectinivorans]|uniref:YfkD family protein n=1 Tax=Sporolactobacillus pectinivorans TaxID=1591408 RepID=UPI000C256356|nr:YfkD family protein [Sporolactobacillus pectinivorans]